MHRREKSLEKEWPELSLSLTRTMTQSEVVYDWNLQVKQESRDQTRASYTEDFLSEVYLDWESRRHVLYWLEVQFNEAIFSC